MPAIRVLTQDGLAEDAVNRLKHEGVPATHVHLLLRETTAPVPRAVEPELEARSVDPLVIGDARNSFAEFIRNGETAIFVRAVDEADVAPAVDTIRQYQPMRIRVVDAHEQQPLGRDIL